MTLQRYFNLLAMGMIRASLISPFDIVNWLGNEGDVWDMCTTPKLYHLMGYCETGRTVEEERVSDWKCSSPYPAELSAHLSKIEDSNYYAFFARMNEKHTSSRRITDVEQIFYEWHCMHPLFVRMMEERMRCRTQHKMTNERGAMG